MIGFFGWIAVMGTVYVQMGEWSWSAFLLGTQVGMLSAVLILVNNIRDRKEDGISGKRTLVVVFGQNFAILLLWLMTLCCYGLNILWAYVFKGPVLFLPMGAFLVGLVICIWVGNKNLVERSKFSVGLGLAAFQLLLFAGLWTLALQFSSKLLE